MKAVIVGSKGQDGSYLVEQLRSKSYTMVGVERAAAVPPRASGSTALDIRDRTAVWRLVHDFKPDEIYYLAAFHQSTEEVVSDEAQAISDSFEINTLALNNFLSAITSGSRPAKLFYAASSRVFGDPVGDVQNEDTLFNPVDPYGISKAAGARICRYYRKELGVFASVGILYNHESPRRTERFVTRKVVKAAVRIRDGRQQKLVIGDLDAIVDWGYAPEYMDAAWRILQLEDPGDFIIASGTVHSVRELIQIAFDAVGLNWELYVEQNPEIVGAARPRPPRGDITRLTLRTGWAPTTSFPDMIRKMVKAEIDDAAKL